MKGFLPAILTVLLLAACGSPSEPGPPPVGEGGAEGPAATATLSVFGTVPPEMLPEQDNVLDPLPTEYVVPAEVLTTEQLHERLNPIGATLSRLPCYGGLTPSPEAELADAVAFYSQIGIEVTNLIPGDYDEARDGTGHLRAWLTTTTDPQRASELGLIAPLVDVFLRDKAVRSIYVGWQYLPPYFSVEQIVAEYGTPDTVEVAFTLAEEEAAFALNLIYAESVDGAFGFGFGGLTDLQEAAVCIDDDHVGLAYLGSFAEGEAPLANIYPTSMDMRSTVDSLGVTPAEAVDTLADGCLAVSAEQLDLWRPAEDGD
ncbi:MAG: hypothetical protein ACFB51_19560 [Anaerolineae bacterium]